MRIMLAATAALGLALSLPAYAQTSRDPLPANPSEVNDGTPAAGTDTAKAPGTDPVARTNVPGGMNNPPTTTSGSAQATQTNTPAPAGQSTDTQTTNTQTTAPAAGSPPTASTDTDSGTAQHHRHHKMASSSESGSDQAESGNGHWAHQPGTGMSGPASSQAANIDSADTRSVIAPHFPQPAGGEDASPARYLHDAEAALSRKHSGEADQALEMAETRLLDRSTAAGTAQQQDSSPAIQQVGEARKAIASRDMKAARAAIHMALATVGGGENGQSAETGNAPQQPGNTMPATTTSSDSSTTTGSGGSSMAEGHVTPTATSGTPAPLSGGMAGGAPANPSGGAAGAQPGPVTNGAGGGPAGTASADSAGGAK